MEFIGVFFVASILSLLVAHFAETLRMHRPRAAALRNEAMWVESSLRTPPVYPYGLLSAYSEGSGQG
jgi:hypothetical protein